MHSKLTIVVTHVVGNVETYLVALRSGFKINIIAQENQVNQEGSVQEREMPIKP